MSLQNEVLEFRVIYRNAITSIQFTPSRRRQHHASPRRTLSSLLNHPTKPSSISPPPLLAQSQSRALPLPRHAAAVLHGRFPSSSRGALLSTPSQLQLTPGTASPRPNGAPKPSQAASPSPECRSRGTEPPPAAGARGQATTGHLSPN